jgi:serine/threonine kinase 32
VNTPNFDLSHELEELLLEEHPLKVRKRKPNRDISRLSPEFRQMEEQYVCMCDPTNPFILTFRQCPRFTTYDFQKTQRQTYYPCNRHIVSSVASITSDLDLEISRPSTPAAFFDAERLVMESVPSSSQHLQASDEGDARAPTMS